jgi:hypothetical protein
MDGYRDKAVEFSAGYLRSLDVVLFRALRLPRFEGVVRQERAEARDATQAAGGPSARASRRARPDVHQDGADARDAR